MAIYGAGMKGRLYAGAEKVKKAYQGNKRVYSSGNICTYRVDTGITYQEEVEEGASCLSPKTFIPVKEGWEFAGWRQDAAAGEVLGSLAMGNDPMELYAVFRQEVVLTTVANGTTNRETKPRLYNNGNVADPVFTVASPAKSGATFKGWSASVGSTAISNSSISNLSLAASTARYAVFRYANTMLENTVYFKIIERFGWYNYSEYTSKSINISDKPVDTSKYSGCTIYAVGCRLYVNGNSTEARMYFTAGSASAYVGLTYVGAAGDVNEMPVFTGTKTITFNQSSGNVYIRLKLEGKGYQLGDGYINNGGNGYIELTGRTVVG